MFVAERRESDGTSVGHRNLKDTAVSVTCVGVLWVLRVWVYCSMVLE